MSGGAAFGGMGAVEQGGVHQRGADALVTSSDLKIRTSFERQMDHGFSVFRVDFVVTIEATGKRQPGKHRRRPVDQFAGIAAIGKDFPKAGDQAEQDGAPADD